MKNIPKILLIFVIWIVLGCNKHIPPPVPHVTSDDLRISDSITSVTIFPELTYPYAKGVPMHHVNENDFFIKIISPIICNYLVEKNVPFTDSFFNIYYSVDTLGYVKSLLMDDIEIVTKFKDQSHHFNERNVYNKYQIKFKNYDTCDIDSFLLVR